MKKVALYLFLILTLAFNWNCKKTGPAEAVITVKDSLGKPVAGAKVVLRQDSVVNPTTSIRANIYQEKTTASTGEAFFSFELEAVLNIEITKDAFTRSDEYIRLEQNKTVRKTIAIN